MSATGGEGLLAVLAELDRIRALMLDAVERSAPQIWPKPPDETRGASQTLYDLLSGARRAILGNPAGAQALLDLLVTEGRRYAETEAGRQLRDDMVASEAVEHLRQIWEMVTFNVLDGPTSPSGVPDAWAELISDAIASESLDDMLAPLRPEGFG